MIAVTDVIFLQPAELVERFVRAPGPGGQNVNKVSSAVELRFDALNSPALSAPVRARLMLLAGQRLTKDGVIVLQASRFRDQARNRQDARDRLIAMIREAAAPPPPPRVKTKPTRSARRKRTDEKTRRGAVKAGRGRVRGED